MIICLNVCLIVLSPRLGQYFDIFAHSFKNLTLCLKTGLNSGLLLLSVYCKGFRSSLSVGRKVLCDTRPVPVYVSRSAGLVQVWYKAAQSRTRPQTKPVGFGMAARERSFVFAMIRFENY